MEDERRPRRTAEMTIRIAVGQAAGIAAARSERQAAFVVVGGMDVGDTIPLRQSGPTVIGRDEECDGIIRDDGISRRHAQVICDASGDFVIEDLGSTNGVWVGGVRVTRHRLADGDKVMLGRRTILRFALQDGFDAVFQRQMYESSVRDPLTGAFNRRHFDERIAAEMSYARRHRIPVTLVMLDLDRFKKINDERGHQAGDLVLRAVSGTLMKALRQEDIFARYGGEEFAVIARGIGVDGGAALGERMRAEVERAAVRDADGRDITVTISAGVCTAAGGSGATPAELVRQADENLYAAKVQGRNRVITTELGIPCSPS